ncbi:oligosaccharide flippase family protein [Marinibacterium sp. SX1]|uniref:oligosaccharide flippase family protein n=1 Tax=Marinibacterium sp. SX1 TaxID=3388424 RepID=UPI003D1825AB
MSAGSPARRGFFVNVGSLVFARGFLALSQVLVLPILARMLSVEDFALMALAMTVVIFTSVLSDAGLGRSLIRAPGYDQVEWSSVFWLLVGVGALLAAGVLAIAPLWAWYFAEPSLTAILSALAMVPFCQAISASHNAEIERREQYTALARLQIVAASSGLVAAVLLALAGAGVWALVVQQVLIAAFRLMGVIRLSRFRPDRVFDRQKIGGHLRFARDAVTTSLISVAQAQAAPLLIAKLLGQGPLGIFAMSQRFTRLPQFGLAGPMSAVVFVRMSKAQDDPARLTRIYLASTRLLASALLPPLTMIAVSGQAVFTVLLSEKWAGIAPVFALSIPGLVLEAVAITCLACLFRAVGRTDLQVRLITEGAVLRVVLVLGAALISLEAVAFSMTLWALAYVPRGWAHARGIVPLDWGDCLRAIAPAALVSAAGALAHLLLCRALAPGNEWEIVMAIGLMCLAFGALALADLGRIKAATAEFR